MAGNHWKECTLSDVCRLIYRYPSFYGMDRVQIGVPVVSGEHFIGRNAISTDWSEFWFVSQEVAAKYPNTFLAEGDIVMVVRGASVGAFARVGKDHVGAQLSPNAIRICPDSRKIDPNFFYYALKRRQTRAFLLGTVSSSAIPSLRAVDIKKAPLRLPRLAEQKAIARALGALDDKIELNRRMNETLEATSRAIFKSWFVDFDPVRAKMDGRQPTGMDANTAALFPDGFEHVAGEVVPKGWRVELLRDRASAIQYGYTASASDELVGPRFLRITDIRGGKVDWGNVPFCAADEATTEKYRVEEGDVFVARTGASTGDNIYIVDPPDAVFASYLVRLKFAHRGVARFVGEYMRTPDYFAYVAGCIGGSAQPNASAQTLAGATVVFPRDVLCHRFFEQVNPMDNARARNDRQSSTLAGIRDTLLPKLLSGEVRVPEATKMVELAS